MVHIRADEFGFPILDERDYKYNQLAMQMMTPEEIQMSQQRELEAYHREIWDFVEKLRRFEKWSRTSPGSKIGACSAA